ncbi:hypothetical protein HYPSUDRAFT_1105438 [Hypholoma sublateritium FD-334 SS-4]|uniref:Magnesium-dependent phosphatase-1 n=1 Tax=Hypholoma sublateritium (strain FD-334 SS-4) TaxID=945553 RepID=A0A0D2P8V8_HYPSF|nr:hypothetical protein HYPSUDRAFT_1105438 [Hypholoma sublateritium FD-334 SS-4]
MLVYPQLIAFDLDYTLWDLWIDTHVRGPLRREKDTLNEVLDRHGYKISFYDAVPQILHKIQEQCLKNEDGREDSKVIIAACSRTHAPDLAHQCLRLLLVPHIEDVDATPKAAIEFFDELEIYPGSKIKHFKSLHERTGIPYAQMLFFDDESRNAEVEKLGVTFVHVPRGMTLETFEQGMREWGRRRSLD